MRRSIPLLAAGIGLLVIASPAFLRPAPLAPPNILLIVADDLGIDNISGYAQGVGSPDTPVIDALAAGGVRFWNAYANPVCSPSRATIQTGRHCFRTGVGSPFLNQGPLQTSEFIIPEMLDAGTNNAYAHAAIGKWHLGNDLVGGDDSPRVAGYDHFSGTKNNVPDYFSYQKIVDGNPVQVNNYATTESVNDALGWIGQQTQPWFCYLAFNAPHSPYHIPPDPLHTQDFSQADTDRRRYKAAVEALDTEIGRLFASLGPELDNTLVIFLGDNGTPGPVIQGTIPDHQSKWHHYQGGVRVPLIISGPGVSVGECHAMVNSVDLYRTIAFAAGVNIAVQFPTLELDSVTLIPYLADPSLPSVRAWSVTEYFEPNGDWMNWSTVGFGIQDGEYKAILSRADSRHPNKALYHLPTDPYEETNLFDLGPLTPDQSDRFRFFKQQLKQLLF